MTKKPAILYLNCYNQIKNKKINFTETKFIEKQFSEEK